jgi:hypothetical protein
MVVAGWPMIEPSDGLTAGQKMLLSLVPTLDALYLGAAAMRSAGRNR